MFCARCDGNSTTRGRAEKGGSRKRDEGSDCSPGYSYLLPVLAKLARSLATRQTYPGVALRKGWTQHGEEIMGGTISTLVFQPPPATFIHNKKHFWLQTRKQTRIPVFHVERRCVMSDACHSINFCDGHRQIAPTPRYESSVG